MNNFEFKDKNNTPNILDNNLDQAPKTGANYEAILNSPEIISQIHEAFDSFCEMS